MRLKCIKLAGFKSFVDPTSVYFPGDMCALVGPNGCGKSNVIDAVRWVMGESSARNLRGESMADVIFDGAVDRQPVDRASIELVFDNHDGSIGGEYADYAEISIKRQVSRGGQSGYYLNGTQCRRRDITEIFLGTGLGPRSYAIIEQGVISRLIESKPEELRTFIEEAAGISRYRERRKETESRLRRTLENLERLTDLREELDRQLQHLQRQARAAEKYSELKAKERTLKAQLLALQWRQLEVRRQSCGQLIGEQELKLESVQAERFRVEAELEQLRTAHGDATGQFNEVQAEVYRLGGDVARTEQDIKYRRERSEQLAGELEQAEKDCAESGRHLHGERQQQQQLQREITALNPELERLREGQLSSAAELLSAETALQSWQQEWDEHQQQAARSSQQAEVQQSRIQHLEQAGQRLQQRIAALEQEERQGSSSASEDAVCQPLAEQIAAGEAELAAQEALALQLHEQVEAAQEQRETLSSKLDENRAQGQAMRGRQASLEALQQAATEPQGGVPQWLQQQGLDGQPLLLEQLQVEPEWQVAVETVLGEYLQAQCVEQIDDLQNALLEPPRGGKLLLVDAAPRAANVPGESLAGKVSGDWDCHSLLGSVLVAADLPEALRQRHSLAAGQSVITRDGIWLGSNWLRVARAADEQGGIIQRRRELEHLQVRIAGQEQQCRSLEQSLAEAVESLRQIESRRQQVQNRLQAQTRQLAELGVELSTAQARAEHAGQRRQAIHGELDELRQQLELEQQALGEARQLLAGAIGCIETDGQRRLQLSARRDAIRADVEAARQLTQQHAEAVHKADMARQSLQVKCAALGQSVERSAGQVEQLTSRAAELRAGLELNQAPMEEMQAKLQEQLQQRSAADEKLSAMRLKVEEQVQQTRQVDTLRTEIEETLLGVRGELEQHKLKNQTLLVEQKTLLEQLRESSHDLESLLTELPEDTAESEWQRMLEQAGHRIARLGLINLAAIDEYQQQSERKNYLDTQNADLESALATLQSAIRKIDRETRSRFRETFDQVNGSLKELFPRVFGGGSAYLEMTGKDLLDTGITIMARPPGKKNSNIHLLSGGEKALTAIALVFSIFRLNPAPFCLLDEVDAPLDDVNAGRYARMVKEMSEHVQFIFITHNKITMEMADQLLGVTMQEPGVSRLVTVDVDEAVEMVAS